ncbi:mechanosensitive ion channel family protein [Rhodoferax sp.]|uniref:mechanosensitive ion channel family protein n=1 Tax=Rhodoferax sp. TaxID=50421 RepID=UPI0025EE6CF1|nr:mechanosensitive ion channel family protein [Rhodoferax sp.]
MPSWTTGLLRPELLALALLTAVLAGVLRWLRPLLQRGLRPTWALLNLAWCAQVLALLAASQDHSLLVGIFRDSAHMFTVWATIQIGTLLVFRVLLPSLRVQLPQIAQDLTLTALSLAWGLVWLRLAGVDPTQLFATSAIMTAVVAFAMQDTLGNVMGGVALQLDNLMRVGEWVQIDELSGRVVDVRWRYTEIVTRNRETVVVPNSWLMKNRFKVLRKQPGEPLLWRRVLHFHIAQSALPSTVLRTLELAVSDASITHVAPQPGPSAVLMEVCAGYHHYALRYWLTDPQFDDPTDSAVRVHALTALAREGIRLGVPLAERLMTHEDEHSRNARDQRELARRTAAIRSIALFASLPDAEQQTLAAHLVHAPFVAGSTITRQGAVAHWLYLILHGEAEVVVDSSAGRTAVARLHDGEFFGEMGLLTGEPRSATVRAVTDVECYWLDKEGFGLVLAARPALAEDIAALLAQRRAEFTARLQQTAAAPPLVRSKDLLARMQAFFGVH